MLPIDVWDEIEFEYYIETSEIKIESTDPLVPTDVSNTVYKAFVSYREAFNWPPWGAFIRIKKGIPSGAGLGGGSSDAAATLKILNALNPSPCGKDELLKIAKGVGADVPFFIDGVPAIAEGIGDILTSFDGIVSYPILLIKPPFEVSTASVYKSLKLTEEKDFISIKAVRDTPWVLDKVMVNDLEVVTFGFYPELKDIKRWLLSEGAINAMMTGSGPTIFGVFRTEEELQRAYLRAIKYWGDGFWIRATKVIPGSGFSWK